MDSFFLRRRYLFLWLAILVFLLIFYIIKTTLRIQRDLLYDKMSRDVEQVNQILESIEDADHHLVQDMKQVQDFINYRREERT